MASCETCQYAYIDEFTGEPLCDLDLDEDEVIRLSNRRSKECPYQPELALYGQKPQESVKALQGLRHVQERL